MKKASNVLFILGWIFAVVCGLVFFLSNGGFAGSSFGCAKQTLLTSIPYLFDWVEFSKFWDYHKVTFIIYYSIFAIGCVLLILEIVFACKRKHKASIARTILFALLAFIVTWIFVFFCYPYTFSYRPLYSYEAHQVITEDGYGLTKFIFDEISNGNITAGKGFGMLLPIILGLFAFIFTYVGEIFRISFIQRLGREHPEDPSVPQNEKVIGSEDTKEEQKSVIYADRHVTIQYFNNYGSAFDESTLRKIIRDELNRVGTVTVEAPKEKVVAKPIVAEKVEEEPKEEPKEKVIKPVTIEVVNSNPEEESDENAQKIIRIPFGERIKTCDDVLKSHYNELKSYALAYGVNSRISNSGDAFRLHTKTYLKITVAGKSLKLYLALDPKKYEDSTIPFADASNKSIYKDIPFVFKVKSDLSLRRAKQLIDEAMGIDGLTLGTPEEKDWIKEL